MIEWSALDGGAPVTGDVGAVMRVAAEFEKIGGEAETLTRRLRSVGDGSGTAVWRGEAAEVFRRLLAETEPDLVKLATNHHAADGALRRYAVSLGDAQDDARRALSDGTLAAADRDAAESQRDRARDEADSAAWTARSAEAQLVTAQARGLVAVDPAYQAQLQQYEARVRVQRDRARAQEAQARRSQAAAQSNADNAGTRLEAAKRLAHQAAQLRDSAARTAARELDDASRAAIDRRNVLQRLWEGTKDVIRDVTASPEFASWLNIISDVGDVLGAAATVMAFVPGLQPLAGALLITAAAFKGVAFAGTLLAYANGHASSSQVLGRGLDFGMALLPMGKAAKLLSKTRAARPDTLAGSIKRVIWYDDARHAKGYLQTVRAAGKLKKGVELTAVTKVGKVVQGVTPKEYFRAKTTIMIGKDVVKGYQGLVNGGRQLGKDIALYHDPAAQDSYADKAPDAAKDATGQLIEQVGEATHKEGLAKGVNVVVKPTAKKVMEEIVK
jgi:hypothetical protein